MSTGNEFFCDLCNQDCTSRAGLVNHRRGAPHQAKEDSLIAQEAQAAQAEADRKLAIQVQGMELAKKLSSGAQGSSAVGSGAGASSSASSSSAHIPVGTKKAEAMKLLKDLEKADAEAKALAERRKQIEQQLKDGGNYETASDISLSRNLAEAHSSLMARPVGDLKKLLDENPDDFFEKYMYGSDDKQDVDFWYHGIPEDEIPPPPSSLAAIPDDVDLDDAITLAEDYKRQCVAWSNAFNKLDVAFAKRALLAFELKIAFKNKRRQVSNNMQTASTPSSIPLLPYTLPQPSDWGDWHLIRSADGIVYLNAITYNGPAIYELGSFTGQANSMVALYLGETRALKNRWHQYCSSGSHLGKSVLNAQAFYNAGNLLYGRFIPCASKEDAMAIERHLLARCCYVWNTKSNKKIKSQITYTKEPPQTLEPTPEPEQTASIDEDVEMIDVSDDPSYSLSCSFVSLRIE